MELKRLQEEERGAQEQETEERDEVQILKRVEE